MTKPWQERVCVHHIDDNPRNNDPDNLRLVHAATSAALTDRELGEYLRWANREINGWRHNPGDVVMTTRTADLVLGAGLLASAAWCFYVWGVMLLAAMPY